MEKELRCEPIVSSEKIGFSVQTGVVGLGGFYEKWGAERAALRVANATSIASEIVVDLPASDTRSDEDITDAATVPAARSDAGLPRAGWSKASVQ